MNNHTKAARKLVSEAWIDPFETAWPKIASALEAAHRAGAEEERERPRNSNEAIEHVAEHARSYMDGFKAGIKEEREACAKICETYDTEESWGCANRIRERNEVPK